MKKIAMWLAVMALGLCLGCQGSMMNPITHNKDKNHVEINLKFRQGQMVNLKIGGHGQIVYVVANGLYRIRIQTDEGSYYELFREFELEITP